MENNSNKGVTNLPNKTPRLGLSQYQSSDVIQFLKQYNPDMDAIDQHGHILVSETVPDELPSDGSLLWYNPKTSVISHSIDGVVKPLVGLVSDLDTNDPNRALSASTGRVIRNELVGKSSVFLNDEVHGVQARPTDLIFRVSSGPSSGSGFTDQMTVGPGFGIRMLTEEEWNDYV